MGNPPRGGNGGKAVDLHVGDRSCLSFGRKGKRLWGTGHVITLADVIIFAESLVYKIEVSEKDPRLG